MSESRLLVGESGSQQACHDSMWRFGPGPLGILGIVGFLRDSACVLVSSLQL